MQDQTLQSMHFARRNLARRSCFQLALPQLAAQKRAKFSMERKIEPVCISLSWFDQKKHHFQVKFITFMMNKRKKEPIATQQKKTSRCFGALNIPKNEKCAASCFYGMCSFDTLFAINVQHTYWVAACCMHWNGYRSFVDMCSVPLVHTYQKCKI